MEGYSPGRPRYSPFMGPRMKWRSIRRAALVRRVLHHHINEREQERREAVFTLRLASVEFTAKGLESRWLAHRHLSPPNPPNKSTLHVIRCEWATIACGGTSSALRSNKPKQPPPRLPNVGASDRVPVRGLSARAQRRCLPLSQADRRMVNAAAYIAYHLGQMDKKLDRLIVLLEASHDSKS